MRHKFLSILIFLAVVFSQAQAEKITIKGKVVAFRVYELNKVSVTAKKAKTQALTELDGTFSIECDMKDILKFKANGFYPKSVKVKDIKTGEPLEVNLIYVEGSASYKKVLNSNHMSQKALDYCTENLMADNNDFHKMNSIYEIIQTVYAGAKIEEDNGRKQVYLNARGANSLFSGEQALLVVDGQIVEDIDYIRPIEVQAVRVLIGTDAGHYGVRGGNGVVEIDLKGHE